jgi:hypothetical protein
VSCLTESKNLLQQREENGEPLEETTEPALIYISPRNGEIKAEPERGNFGATTLSKMTFNIPTLSIKCLYVTLSIECFCCYAESYYAERRVLFISMLSVIMLNVVNAECLDADCRGTILVVNLK